MMSNVSWHGTLHLLPALAGCDQDVEAAKVTDLPREFAAAERISISQYGCGTTDSDYTEYLVLSQPYAITYTAPAAAAGAALAAATAPAAAAAAAAGAALAAGTASVVAAATAAGAAPAAGAAAATAAGLPQLPVGRAAAPVDSRWVGGAAAARASAAR